MIRLYDAERNTLLGEISDEQLQFLAARLEEESTTDQDYFINVDTVDMLEEEGADEDLVAMLREAIEAGDGEGLDVRWEQA